MTIFSCLNQFLRDKETYIGDSIISRKTNSLQTELKRKNYLRYLFSLFFWLFPTKGQERPFALVFMTEHDLKLMSGQFLFLHPPKASWFLTPRKSKQSSYSTFPWTIIISLLPHSQLLKEKWIIFFFRVQGICSIKTYHFCILCRFSYIDLYWMIKQNNLILHCDYI